MPASNNRLARLAKDRRDRNKHAVVDQVTVEDRLSRLEEDIRRLKVEYDIYFNGGTKRPPLEARARLEAFIRRVSDSRTMSYAQRYQLSTLVAKYSSYRELWRRMLRAKGEELI